MSKPIVISIFALACLGVGCSTVQVTRVQPGRGGELAIQEGLFGEPAHVKAERVMQGQCPEGYEIEEDGEVKVGSVTTTQSETQGKSGRNKIAASTTTVSETHDKTQRRVIWKCKGTAPVEQKGAPARTATAQPIPPAVHTNAQVAIPVPPAPVPAQVTPETTNLSPSIGLQTTTPTGWSADIALGRRWYKAQDASVGNFHSTTMDFRMLYEVLPGFEVGGDMHVDGYDNDTNADSENFSSSLFEFGLTTKLSHSFGVWKPYLVANSFFYGEGNREYERNFGFTSEKYSGRNKSRGIDGALGLAWKLGEGSVYFEWYRSADREMTVKGRLEKQTALPNGSVFSTVEGDQRSFKTRYDGFALGVSLPIKN